MEQTLFRGFYKGLEMFHKKFADQSRIESWGCGCYIHVVVSDVRMKIITSSERDTLARWGWTVTYWDATFIFRKRDHGRRH